MNDTNGYRYVVHPGTISGVAFVTSYELPELAAPVNDELPETRGNSPSEQKRWIQAVVRLPKAFHRLVRHNLWRRAEKAASAA